MDIKQSVDLLISIAGLGLGLTYIFGGLIVNLKLSRYGITQYQVLKVNYLVVGLAFILSFIAILILSTLPAFLLLSTEEHIFPLFALVSLTSSLILLWFWGKNKVANSFFSSWTFWIAIGSISFTYPITILLQVCIYNSTRANLTYEILYSIGLAFLIFILSLISLIYFYARHLYGRPNKILGSLDPIGMGIPREIQLVGDKEKILNLKYIGVPMISDELSDKVILLDETNDNYIIKIDNDQEKAGAAEISKDIIKAIRYF